MFTTAHVGSDDITEETAATKYKKLLKLPLKTVEHYTAIGVYMKQLYEKDLLLDVFITVKNTKFGAHRIALSCHSEFFSTLFKNTKKKVPIEVTIQGVTAESFACFLEFCYTGVLIISKTTAADMLIMADYLKVRALKRQCVEIADSLPLDQTVKMIVKSDPESNGKLYHIMFKRISQQFSEAAETDYFLNVSFEQMEMFLSQGQS